MLAAKLLFVSKRTFYDSEIFFYNYSFRTRKKERNQERVLELQYFQIIFLISWNN